MTGDLTVNTNLFVNGVCTLAGSVHTGALSCTSFTCNNNATIYGNLYVDNPYISLNGTSLYNNNMIELHPGNSGITATNVYGLGVNGGILRLNSQGAFKFYNNNSLNYTIDASGNTTQAGTITSDSNIFTQRLIIKNVNDGYGSGGLTNEFPVHAQVINLENNFWPTNGIADCNTAYDGTMLRLDNRTIINQYYQFWKRSGSTYSLLAYLNSSSSGLIATSDRNLKNTIQAIKCDKSLNSILNTNICSFFYNHASEDDIKENRKSIGVIAQDLQTVNPHCVLQHKNLDETTNLGVSYNDLFLHNINATKQLFAIIQGIDTRLKVVEGIDIDLNESLNNVSVPIISNTNNNITTPIIDEQARKGTCFLPCEDATAKALRRSGDHTDTINELLSRIDILEQIVRDQQSTIDVIKKALKKIKS
jgi:hypothetical protein